MTIEELKTLYRKATTDDLVDRAILLASYQNPNDVFLEDGTLKAEKPFGVLIMFGTEEEQLSFVGNTPYRCDDIERIKALAAGLLQNVPAGDAVYFENAKDEFKRAYMAYMNSNRATRKMNKELKSLQEELEKAREKADILSEPLMFDVPINPDLQKEINEYTESLQTSELHLLELKEEQVQARREYKKFQKIQQKHRQKLKQLQTERIDLEKFLTISNRLLHPFKYTSVKNRIEKIDRMMIRQKVLLDEDELNLYDYQVKAGIGTQKIDEVEKEADRIRTSLEESQKALEEAMAHRKYSSRVPTKDDEALKNLDQQIEFRKQQLTNSMSQTKAQRKETVVAAGKLLHAWLSTSSYIRYILNDLTTFTRYTVLTRAHIEAIFFVSGALYASGPDACSYMRNRQDLKLKILAVQNGDNAEAIAHCFAGAYR